MINQMINHLNFFLVLILFYGAKKFYSEFKVEKLKQDDFIINNFEEFGLKRR